MSDARTAKRFSMHLPIAIGSVRAGKKHRGTTDNLSAAGAYIWSDADFEVGSKVEFSLVLPAEVVGGRRDVEIQCRGRVIRSDEGRPSKRHKKHGLACVIDDYRFKRA